jgi:sugar phosphate isomerase/epimerase
MSIRLSLFSACAPWEPFDALVPRLARLGFSGLEPGLRERAYDAAKPPDFWGNNPAMLDWRDAEREAAALRALCDAHGLAIPVLGSYASWLEDERNALAARTARILGAGTVRVRAPGRDPKRPYAEQLAEGRAAWQRLEHIGQAHDVRFQMQLHDNSLAPSASAALRFIEGRDPAYCGVGIDVANMTVEGNERLDLALDALGPHLAHVYAKDIVPRTLDAPRHGTRFSASWVPLGQGHLDWPGIVALLRARGYAGWISVISFTELARGPERLEHDAGWGARAMALR